MKFRRLEVEGFAQFGRLDINFLDDAPSLIVGPNEAGKSHVMHAFYGMLFGLEQPERFKPWTHDTGPMRGALEFEDDEKRSVRLERSFGTSEVTVRTAERLPWTARMGPGAPIAEAERYYSALERWLGFGDAKVFTATTFVHQSEVAQASLNGAAPQIRNLITGTGDADFERALADLRQELDTLRTAHKKRSPRLLEQKEQELNEMETLYRAAGERQARIARLQERQKGLRVAIESQSAAVHEKRAFWDRVRKVVEQEALVTQLQEELDAIQLRLGQFVEAHERLEQARTEKSKYAAVEATDLVTLLSLEHAVRVAEQQIEVARQQAAASPRYWRWFQIALAVAGAVIGLGLGYFVSRYLLLVIIMAGVVLAILGWRLGWLAESAVDDAPAVEATEQELSRAMGERARVFEKLGAYSVEETVTLRKTYEFKERALEKAQAALDALGDEAEVDERWEHARQRLMAEQGRLEDLLESDVDLRILGTPDERAALSARQGEEVAHLEHGLADLHSQEADVRQQLLLEGSEEQDVAVLYLQMQAARQEITRLRRRVDALETAISTLEACVEDFRERCLDPVMVDASEILRQVTDGRYVQVHLNDADLSPVVDMVGRSGIRSTSLSRGVQDQLYFAIRVSLAKALGGGRALPLLLDDPYVNLDNERLERTISLLRTLAQRTQIILFTCDTRYEQWFEPVLRLERVEEIPAAPAVESA